MTHKILPIRRNRNWELMLSGMATLTINPSVTAPKMPKTKSTTDALRDDWRAIGGDMRRAMGKVGKENEAA